MKSLPACQGQWGPQQASGTPRTKKKDPTLLDYVKLTLEDDEEDPDSPPLSSNLDGLSERQQAHKMRRYNITKQQFNDKKKRWELNTRVILGCIPDTLGVVELQQGQIE
ncbi:hypothetical protein BDQ17DRAFT_1336122 [Cyathus striatus]|nr:hypothetical protein BDQ17DRAFT_1336122 [Cyathus striatus]